MLLLSFPPVLRGALALICVWLLTQFSLTSLALAEDRSQTDGLSHADIRADTRSDMRADIQAFLTITGFDQALDSIAHSAEDAPSLIGLAPRDFGGAWEAMAADVFDPALLRESAVALLEETLSPAAMNHAIAFYGSPLGARLVQAENASHDIEDGAVTVEAGTRIIDGLVRRNDPRLAALRRLGQAVDAGDGALWSIQQIQLRFLVAAAAAGLVELRADTDELWAAMQEQSVGLRIAMQSSTLAQNAYTYQGFDLADLTAYAEALEHPTMQEVYALLNAVQFELQAERFEALAARMGDQGPGADL